MAFLVMYGVDNYAGQHRKRCILIICKGDEHLHLLK